jgi:hypothetical protein
MKLTFTRASALLAMALGLAACGGKATFELSGPVTGLVYPGLVITNKSNGEVVTVAALPSTISAATGLRVATATTFKMGQTLEYGQAYDLQITTTPPHQTCTLYHGTDTAGRLSAISIPVDCSVTTFPIGGTVSGLIERPATDTTSARLTVTNGGDTLVIEKNATTEIPKYFMAGRVAYDDPYAVRIVVQPLGQTCTVANGTGRVKTVVTPGVIVPPATTAVDVVTDPVDNINITCVTN